MTENKDKISIFSSHSFIRSPYKDKIISAIQDPVNKELLVQLKDYIDFDSIPEKYKQYSKTPIDQEEHKKADKEEDNSLSKKEDVVDTKPKSSSPEEEEGSEEDDADSSKASLTSSVSIKAQTVLNSAPCCQANKLQSEVILATLNSIDNTSGVYRVTCVEPNEVWVYYKDDINLNNVMPNVIDILASSGFYYLTFNRLARTQNAIVFEFDPSNVIIGDGNGKTEEK